MNPNGAPPPGRLGSIDAFRGFVMFLMMAGVLRLYVVADSFPDDPVWQTIKFHTTHVEWVGCSLHDLIQPGFTFLVGVALPFSLAARLARGQSKWRMTFHAAWRALLLVALGVFLRSTGSKQTNFTFEDTLTQIGLGYFPLFLIGMGGPMWRWLALVVILAGYWALFALYELPMAGYYWPGVGVPMNWEHHLTGFAAHWDKNFNPASGFDVWFLNQFPREKPFRFNGGGYATLSFIPTLATMILGLMAGKVLQRERPALGKIVRLVLAGAVCMAAGWAADFYGVCPIVKRIWTPSWVLYSGGWCFFILAGCYAVIDVAGLKAWSFPLRVIGMNSIAAYCMAQLMKPFVEKSLKTHIGADTFKYLGDVYEPLMLGGAILLVYWLILFWMYRRKIFLRI